MTVANAIANHPLAKRCGQFRREIAHLISVRQQDQIGLSLRDGLLERNRISVRRVRCEQIVFDKQHFIEIHCRQFIGQRSQLPCR